MNDENDYGAALTADVTAGQAAPEAASHVGHTPAPWRMLSATRFGEGMLYAGVDEIGLMYGSDGADEPTPFPGIANAAFIVRACNCHDELLAALKGMLDQPETPQAYDAMMARAQAAIKKAEQR